MRSIINRFIKSHIWVDSLHILDIKTDVNEEKWDWAVTHGNFDKSGYTGNGERIAILDTGIDTSHDDLKGIITPACFINNCKDYPVYFDGHGHGTFVAGEVVAQRNNKGLIGIAPNATCFSAKVLYGNAKDNAFSLRDIEIAIANAIYAAVKEGCGVISMSLGMPFRSRTIEEAVTFATNSGVICCAAAGNEGMLGQPVKSYPAALENVISVASANQYDLPTWFSTQGIGTIYEQPEIAISSLEYYWGCLPINRYGKMQGTSMACPLLGGVALLWREAMTKNNLLPQGQNVLNEFRKWLVKNSIDSNKNGWDSFLGFGVLRLINNKIET